MEIENQASEGYQVIVVNMTYDKEQLKSSKGKWKNKIHELPEPMIMEVPEDILSIVEEQKFRDVVETYVYDTIYKKFGVELYRCQIWLPPVVDVK